MTKTLRAVRGFRYPKNDAMLALAQAKDVHEQADKEGWPADRLQAAIQANLRKVDEAGGWAQVNIGDELDEPENKDLLTSWLDNGCVEYKPKAKVKP